jgi:hypothetical protein
MNIISFNKVALFSMTALFVLASGIISIPAQSQNFFPLTEKEQKRATEIYKAEKIRAERRARAERDAQERVNQRIILSP